MLETFSIYPDLSYVADPYAGILLDANGVFWGGNQIGLLDGAKQAMKRLVDQGKVVGILSNSTQLSESESQKFAKQGLNLNEHFHFILTSGELTRQKMLTQTLNFPTQHQRYWTSSSVHPNFPLKLFDNTDFKLAETLDCADFIYASVPHINGEDQTNPEVFKEEIKQLVAAKLPMLCANPDHFAHEGKPAKMVVRQGAIAALYKEMGGEVHYVGKPYSYAFEIALNTFKNYGIDQAETILMVGDTPETDSLGAQKAKMDSALIIETGILAERFKGLKENEMLKQIPPDHLPKYFIKRLGS